MTEGLIVNNLLVSLFLNFAIIVSCSVLMYLISQRCRCIGIIHEGVCCRIMEIRSGCKRFQRRLWIIKMLFFLHQHSWCHCREYRVLRPVSIYDRLTEASTLSFINFWVSWGDTILLRDAGLTISRLLEVILVLYQLMWPSFVKVLRHLINIRC